MATKAAKNGEATQTLPTFELPYESSTPGTFRFKGSDESLPFNQLYVPKKTSNGKQPKSIEITATLKF